MTKYDNESRRRHRRAEEESGAKLKLQGGQRKQVVLDVHWQFDKRAGSAVGRRVADYVSGHGLVAPDDQRSRQPAQ
ncbi:hypothetical protein CR152_26785 [Massilia violaceinigra]|uniref:Uncharacterized protein n=1 Tax=Massilia violaceinigra TaxID=2045208 RepID=A0A2D2DRV5_9BURK|nr:hypothetical protein [Massilia violaceinigra]ATQ77711.1 hypothetical protein CR152_26785 [Massilia violaceinigra]